MAKSTREKTIEQQQHIWGDNDFPLGHFGEVNDVHSQAAAAGSFDFLHWYKTTRTYQMRSEEAQTARRHLPIYFLSRKKKVKSKIRRSETTVSQRDVVVSEGLSIIGQDAPVSFAVPFLWGWWLLSFFLSLFRLYKYRCDYHRNKKNLFRCHYHSQSLIIHGVIPPRRTRDAHNSLSLSKPNGATKPEVSDRFRPIPSFTLKTFGDSTLYLSNSFAFDGKSWRCYWSYLKKTKKNTKN